MFNHSSASASTPAPEFFSLEPATTTPGTPVSGAPNSVIVRTPQELGGAGGFPHTPQWSATGTPTGYSYNFPFFFPPTDFNFFPPSSTDSCSTGTSNLQSPILQGAGALDLHGGLNPLNRFPNYGRGVGLPYSDLSGPLMGTQKVHKGGRRPREEMTRNGELDDPEEAEKKLKRRQRNKEAAARCRQRRLDLMETLQGQVDRLKGENDGKEREIRNMSDKLNRLVDFIRKHQCNLSNDDMSSLESILSSAGSGGYSNNNVNNVAPQQQHYDRGSVSSTSSVSIASDYQPQNSNPPVSRAPLGPPAHPPAERKRPFVTSMPPTSANEDLEEPEIKLGRMLAGHSSDSDKEPENAIATATAIIKEEILDPELDKSGFSASKVKRRKSRTDSVESKIRFWRTHKTESSDISSTTTEFNQDLERPGALPRSLPGNPFGRMPHSSLLSTPVMETTPLSNMGADVVLAALKAFNETATSNVGTPLSYFAGPNSVFGTPVETESSFVDFAMMRQSLELTRQESALSNLESSVGVPKIENDQLIGGTNLARPTNLMGMNFSSVMNASVPITTPSRDLLSSAMHGGTPAFNLDSFGREGLLGNQSTGLTPSGAPQINFVIQTPTPLAQDGEYRSL